MAIKEAIIADYLNGELLRVLAKRYKIDTSYPCKLVRRRRNLKGVNVARVHHEARERKRLNAKS